MRRQQVDLQQSSCAAKLIWQTFRQDSCHANARRPVQRPPWAPGGPSAGRLGCQEACRNAVLGARRPVGTPSWAPGGPSGGCLGRQEARREVVLGARRPVGRPSWAPGGPSGGRLGRQEARRQAVWAASQPELDNFCIDNLYNRSKEKLLLLNGFPAGGLPPPDPPRQNLHPLFW